jgi:hypothetical protein
MLTYWPRTLLVTAMLVCATGVATAQQYPEAYVQRPQTVPDNVFQFRGDVFFNLSNRSISKPIILAPSLEYGITNSFQIAVRHENSFCVNGCDFYRGVGFEGKYVFARGNGYSFSVFGGPYINAFEPFLLQLRTGLGFWANPGETFALNGNLYFGWGLTRRADSNTFVNRGVNEDVMVLSLQPAINFSPRWAGFIDTGFNTTLSAFEDVWAIPFGFGALYTHKRNLDFGGDFKFPRFLAAPYTGTLELRQLDLFMRYRW